MKHTDAILDFAAADHVLPANVRADALRLLADAIAGGAAGANSPRGKRLFKMVCQTGEVGTARLIGSDVKLSAASGAYFNAFSAHCLEWDPVHEPAVVHALSVVTGALLAASDRLGGGNEEKFLTALAIGVDISSGLGICATSPMRFFRPANAGLLGAALAVAHIEGASRADMVDILGLAYSHAGGTMQAHLEASIALPLQIADAARSAILANDLVKAGMDGPHDVLEGPFGYSALFDDLDLTQYTPTLGKLWRISEVSTKPFPSGRASHAALGVVSDLMTSPEFDPSQVQSAILYAPPLVRRLVGRPYKPDMKASYARLCLPFLMPLMLRDGYIDPSYFDAQGMADPALAAFSKKVQVVVDNNSDGNAMSPQRLVLTMKDGQEIEMRINATLGSPEAPMNEAQSANKYALCRRLAHPQIDPRIFDNPLSYTTEIK